MRTLASIGVAAVLAMGPAATAGGLDAGASLEPSAATAAPALTRPGGVSTNGFISDLNCFFFKRC